MGMRGSLRRLGKVTLVIVVTFAALFSAMQVARVTSDHSAPIDGPW